jgi:hypothetical protein
MKGDTRCGVFKMKGDEGESGRKEGRKEGRGACKLGYGKGVALRLLSYPFVHNDALTP